VTDDKSSESIELMEEVPLKRLGETELESSAGLTERSRELIPEEKNRPLFQSTVRRKANFSVLQCATHSHIDRCNVGCQSSCLSREQPLRSVYQLSQPSCWPRGWISLTT